MMISPADDHIGIPKRTIHGLCEHQHWNIKMARVSTHTVTLLLANPSRTEKGSGPKVSDITLVSTGESQGKLDNYNIGRS